MTGAGADTMIASAEATPPGLFTARGFFEEMRRGNSTRSAALLTGDGSALAPSSLDEYPDSAAAWVAGMYALVFRRAADRSALDTHTRFLRTGGDPAALLKVLKASSEARDARLHGPTDLAEAFVVGAYLVILGRLPDPRGLATHVAKLQEGVTPDGILHQLWGSDEARAGLRIPPRPVDRLDILARKIQTVGLRISLEPETTAWVRDALEHGTPTRRVIRSLARRRYGVSPHAALVLLTAPPRVAAAVAATAMAVRREELRRDRLWQLQLHRATGWRLDRLEHLLTASAASSSERLDGDGRS